MADGDKMATYRLKGPIKEGEPEFLVIPYGLEEEYLEHAVHLVGRKMEDVEEWDEWHKRPIARVKFIDEEHCHRN